MRHGPSKLPSADLACHDESPIVNKMAMVYNRMTSRGGNTCRLVKYDQVLKGMVLLCTNRDYLRQCSKKGPYHILETMVTRREQRSIAISRNLGSASGWHHFGNDLGCGIGGSNHSVMDLWVDVDVIILDRLSLCVALTSDAMQRSFTGQ